MAIFDTLMERAMVSAGESRRKWLFSWRGFLLIVWLISIYSGWLTFVSVGDHWETVKQHWHIALAMVMGSYFAGSTPMGGGTVGFPVLTLMLGEAPSLGRDFSFAIQSVGMVSASVFIFCLGHPVVWSFLKWAIIGSLISTPLGITFISPMVPGLVIQVFFAVIWAGFGILHFWKLNEFSNYLGMMPMSPKEACKYGLSTGFFAGLLISSVLGVGIDLALYAVLVLVFRCDLRLAIPTSVILMAFTSLVGISTQALSGSVNPEVFGYWVAAAPVVAIGAPLGAIIVKKIGRKPTLLIVSGLCLLQLIWTLVREFHQLKTWGVVLSLCAVGLFFGIFFLFYRSVKPSADTHPAS